MRIYYFGELVEDTNNPVPKTREEIMQTAFEFSDESEQPKRSGMPSIGDLLEDIDLSLEAYRPLRKVVQ